MKTSTDLQPLFAISRAQTRTTGVLYLLLAVIGPFSLIYVPSTLYVAGDAAATAQKITSAMGLFRAGIAGDMLIVMIEVVLSVLLYKLLAPVSKTLSLIATSARLGMTVVQAINVLKNSSSCYFSVAMYLCRRSMPAKHRHWPCSSSKPTKKPC